MKHDHVDMVLHQWQTQRPDIDSAPMGVIGRLVRANRIIEKQLKKPYKNHDLSFIEFDILATMRRCNEPLTPTELYKVLMMSSGAMSTRIEHLVQRGLITRLASDEDRRSCKVVLTDAGFTLINKLVEEHVANEKEILTPLSIDEQNQLSSLLRRWLIDNEA